MGDPRAAACVMPMVISGSGIIMVVDPCPRATGVQPRVDSDRSAGETIYAGLSDLMKDIREHGIDRGDRTGTGTRSVFGRQLRFDLTAGVPRSHDQADAL